MSHISYFSQRTGCELARSDQGDPWKNREECLNPKEDLGRFLVKLVLHEVLILKGSGVTGRVWVIIAPGDVG